MLIKIRFFILFLFFISSFLFSVSSRAEQPHIVFTTFEPPNESVLGKICELTFTEAFRRLGMKFSVKVFPIKRAAAMISAGKFDGELGRSFHFSDNSPNLIRLEESFISARIVAFAKEPGIKVNGFNSLQHTRLRVVYPLGATTYEASLSMVVPAKNLATSNHRVSALQMLLKKRADIYIDGELDIQKILQENDQFKNSKIYVAGVLIDVPLYAFLQKKHKDLIPKLAQVIREMKVEGIIKKYIKMALSSKFP